MGVLIFIVCCIRMPLPLLLLHSDQRVQGVSVGGPSTGDSLSAVGSVLDVVRMEVHLIMR